MRALTVWLLLVVGGCSSGGEAESVTTVQDVANAIGCSDPQETGNAADLAEITCKLSGEEVTITDWSGASRADRDTLINGSANMGFHVIEVTDDITAGAESVSVAEQIQDKTAGEWLSAG